MNLTYLIAQLELTAQLVHDITQNISDEQARWKPTPDSWSILEVVNHLWDEEIEDFRAHVDHTLYHAGEAWPPIDPQGWVTARRYNERTPGESLQGFMAARQASMAWLKTLDVPDWKCVARAPFGPISAGDVMVSWVAHDLLHMRQLVRLQFLYTTQAVVPYSTRYAGEW